jgi:hypothetical protein
MCAMPELPAGLEVCAVCDTMRGVTADGARSVCLCDGLPCVWCGLGRSRRPISDYYGPDAGRWLHVPAFGRRGPCRCCEATALRLGERRRWHP